MDNMKLLRYARAAAVDKWWCYDKIATQYAGPVSYTHLTLPTKA